VEYYVHSEVKKKVILMEIVEVLFHPLLLLSHKFNRPFPFITVTPLFKAASQEHNTVRTFYPDGE